MIVIVCNVIFVGTAVKYSLALSELREVDIHTVYPRVFLGVRAASLVCFRD